MNGPDWDKVPQDWFSTYPDMMFAEFLNWEKATHDTIDFKKSYVDMAEGDLYAGLVLSEIIYWYLPSRRGETNKLRITRNGRQWIACKRAEWWERVRLKPKQLDTALKQLIKLGLVVKDTFKFSGENTLHVSLEIPAFVKAWRHYTQNPTPLNPRSQNGNLEVPKMGIQELPNREFPYTESTTKTTTKKKDSLPTGDVVSSADALEQTNTPLDTITPTTERPRDLMWDIIAKEWALPAGRVGIMKKFFLGGFVKTGDKKRDKQYAEWIENNLHYPMSHEELAGFVKWYHRENPRISLPEKPAALNTWVYRYREHAKAKTAAPTQSPMIDMRELIGGGS